MIAAVFLVALAFYAVAYFAYGRFLDRRLDIDPQRPTPSHAESDGVDRIPAPRAILLGHHFSSIAGAGPIVGPIIAAIAFGWLPVLLWVLIGAVLIGGVHDFSALVASIRHRARSIAEVCRLYMSPVSYRLFLAFIWLTLVYVLTVFADLTAATFVGNAGVATSSIFFVVLAVGLGLTLYRLRISVPRASLVFVPLVFVAVWAGQKLPLLLSGPALLVPGDAARTWAILLLAYCFVASTTPVWLLLQPRDYLSSFLLYASLLGGFAGILIGGFSASYPAFVAWQAPQLGALFPILFITVACGACSGFHSIVASGTTSKQLDNERDARFVGYGAMLVEGLVAVVALATVMMVPRGDPSLSAAPPLIYAAGLGRLLASVGLPEQAGVAFGLMALSAFLLTTLDTATRLSRYVFEEFFSLKGRGARYISTAATLALPALFVMVSLKDPAGQPIPVWKAIWPVFGATNQLLAGLSLLVVAVWLRRTGRRAVFALAPAAFMIVVTVWALVQLMGAYRRSLVGAIATVLLGLAVVLAIEAVRVLLAGHRAPAEPAPDKTVTPKPMSGEMP